MKMFFPLLIVVLNGMPFSQAPQKDQMPPGVAIRKYKWEKVGPAPQVDASMKAESDSPSGSGSSDPNAVSYTHLTLPTILRV